MSAEFAEEDSEEKDDYEDKDNYDEDDEDDDNNDYDDGDSGGSLGNGFANDSYDETMHDDSGNTDPDGALEPTNDLLPHSSSNMTSAKAKAGDQCLRDQSLRDLLALQQIEAFAARRAHLTLAAETASAALSSLVRKAEAYADGDALLSTWRDVELSPVVRVALENAIGSHKRTHARVVELERLLLPASRELRGLARLDPSA
jgi:hypothetical protein